MAQGSILSALLVNLYYGTMERRLFADAPGCLVMRVMDDTLVVSTEAEAAGKVVQVAMEADRAGLFKLNRSKTRANFACPAIAEAVPPSGQGSNGDTKQRPLHTYT